jgi:hypothetical protein
MVLTCGYVIERSYNKMKDRRKVGGSVVFLTYPVYPFVIQHAQRPPAP